MKIFLIIFSTLVLTFVGKSVLAHTFTSSLKAKFTPTVDGKIQFLNAVEEEDISEDLHDEQDQNTGKYLIRIISPTPFSSERPVQISLADKFEIIKSNFLALFKQHANFRI